jgi:NAD(P)-dependent dehydrogenase (short-subunit alcohol dehydrogenase family)
MPQDFTGRVVAVSGAASGIGFATAQYLYSLGATLSITDIRQEALDAAVPLIISSPVQAASTSIVPKGLLQNTEDILSASRNDNENQVQLYGDRLLAIVTDVRASKQVDRWIEQTVKAFGKLDHAANLAGVVGRGIGRSLLTELTDDAWAFVLDINLTGVFYAMRAQLRALGKGGSIVNAASTAGIEGGKCNSDYAASKHGVVGLTRSAAKEVGGRGVRVNAIAP